ncbi:hypothetical protein BKA62DRAFT_230991 [Auriculariales sp. MPI-PUGE-AT-0066]|nr:hypothetical protein BKA62DRAFT_230991 [Auriculariales sp. MPI-PUGE-AT-0066]
MANVVSRLHLVQLPPAESIAPAARPDLITATQLRNAVQGAAPPATIANLKTQMQNDAIAVDANSHAAADFWVGNAFVALQTIIDNVPAVDRPGTLFIVSTPEFGLNGRLDGGGNLTWNAGSVFPDRLRTYIAGRVDARLAGMAAGLNILFSFSCCAYPDNPVDTVEGNSRVGMNNQITIRSLAGGAVTGRTVRKRIPTVADGMLADFELITAWADGAVGAAQTRPTFGPQVVRDVEVVYNSPWRTLAQMINIGFATCQDTGLDSHPACNFVVVSSAGATFFRRDVDVNTNPFSLKPFLLTQPFTLNDKNSWLTQGPISNPVTVITDGYTTAQLYAPGYYRRNINAPGGWAPSVGTMVANMRASQNRPLVNGQSTVATEMATTYNNPRSVVYNYPAPPLPAVVFISSSAADLHPPFAAPVVTVDIPAR